MRVEIPANENEPIAIAISNYFILHVREIYMMAIEDIGKSARIRKGINGHTVHGLPAYIIAVAAIEAFVNEVFLENSQTKWYFPKSPLWKFPQEWLDRTDLGIKLILVPQLLLGKSFSKDTQPYQDIAQLIRVRNDLVHYKVLSQSPKYVKDLVQRGIALAPHVTVKWEDYSWPDKLSTSEGIRWAHNTACQAVEALVSFMPEIHRDMILLTPTRLKAFSPISDDMARNFCIQHGIDPDSESPTTTHQVVGGPTNRSN